MSEQWSGESPGAAELPEIGPVRAAAFAAVAAREMEEADAEERRERARLRERCTVTRIALAHILNMDAAVVSPQVTIEGLLLEGERYMVGDLYRYRLWLLLPCYGCRETIREGSFDSMAELGDLLLGLETERHASDICPKCAQRVEAERARLALKKAPRAQSQSPLRALLQRVSARFFGKAGA